MSKESERGKAFTELILQHHGILGMHWGQRKVEPTTYVPQSKVVGLNKFHPEFVKSLDTVALHAKNGYGYEIKEFKPIVGKASKQAYGQVNYSKRGQNVIAWNNTDTVLHSKKLIDDSKFFVPSGGHTWESLMTHELGHSMMHTYYTGKKDTSIINDNNRQKIWNKTVEQALKDGAIRNGQTTGDLAAHISTYAGISGTHQEAEAEMFAAYHWSPNPPKYVDVFMQEVHKEFGVSSPPFSGRRVKP